VILADVLERLAAWEPTSMPFISLYVNAQPDEHGRPHFDAFVRKELAERVEAYPLRSLERRSFERSAEWLRRYLAAELRPAANGAALFACAGPVDFFEAVQLEAPIHRHALTVADLPNLYPLARVNDQYRRFGALVADSHTARLLVFEAGARVARTDVQNPKVRRSSGGGWAQARYQRHVENYQLHHAKDVVEALDDLAREFALDRLVLAGDEVILPILRDQLPKRLREAVVGVVRLEIRAPDAEVFRASLDVLRAAERRRDAEIIERLFDACRGTGRGVLGVRATRSALDRAQVEELVLAPTVEQLSSEGPEEGTLVANRLVTVALRTGARLTFVEDGGPLAAAEGVGALLRYAA
jgi:peptide subunit release factor 1 (eRF1)